MLTIDREMPNFLPLEKLANQNMLPAIIFLHFLNVESVAQGASRKLHCQVVENVESVDRNTRHLARVVLLGKNPVMEISEEINNLSFDQFKINILNQTLLMNKDDINITLLNEEEYQEMLNDFFDNDDLATESIKSEEKDQSSAEHSILYKFNYLLAKTRTIYFKFTQKFVLRLKQLREQELYRNTENTRQRKKKERDKHWNQRMDYWLTKELNHYYCRVESVKRDRKTRNHTLNYTRECTQKIFSRI